MLVVGREPPALQLVEKRECYFSLNVDFSVDLLLSIAGRTETLPISIAAVLSSRRAAAFENTNSAEGVAILWSSRTRRRRRRTQACLSRNRLRQTPLPKQLNDRFLSYASSTATSAGRPCAIVSCAMSSATRGPSVEGANRRLLCPRHKSILPTST